VDAPRPEKPSPEKALIGVEKAKSVAWSRVREVVRERGTAILIVLSTFDTEFYEFTHDKLSVMPFYFTSTPTPHLNGRQGGSNESHVSFDQVSDCTTGRHICSVRMAMNQMNCTVIH
jgi:hypothetical protein